MWTMETFLALQKLTITVFLYSILGVQSIGIKVKNGGPGMGSLQTPANSV